VRKRFIEYCVAASIPGLDAREAGLFYDHIAAEPQNFLKLVEEMRAKEGWETPKTKGASG
jgi:hypothetical protein